MLHYSNGEPDISNTIWECYYDFKVTTFNPQIEVDSGNEIFDFEKGEEVEGGWCVERIRTDKRTPNDERVVNSVFEAS